MAEYFTVNFKQRLRVTAATVTMVAGAAPFVAGLLAMQTLGDQPTGLLPATVALVSFVLGGMLPWLTQNVLGLAGNAGLRQRLAQRLVGECSLEQAVFVGFSPGQDLRVWQGETDRDVGFLCVSEESLAYHGDEYAWGLPRDLIDHIDMTPPEGGVLRILVHWHVPREVSRTFSLECREAHSLSGARKATGRLYARLREWYKAGDIQDATASGSEDRTASVTGHGTPYLNEALGLPPTDVTGGQAVDQPPSGSCASILSIGVIMLILIWRVAGAFFGYGRYYEGILWAGLISVLGALSMGYLLHYLQAWEAKHGRQVQRER